MLAGMEFIHRHTLKYICLEVEEGLLAKGSAGAEPIWLERQLRWSFACYSAASDQSCTEDAQDVDRRECAREVVKCDKIDCVVHVRFEISQ